ncbi:MAG TPA: type II CAAX endopeptidase family protein [Solirubrobacteraceae bacterium]
MQTPPPPTGTPLDLPPPQHQPTEEGPAAWQWWQGALALITSFVGAGILVAIIFAVGSALFGGAADDPRGGVMLFGLVAQDVIFVFAVVLFAGLRGGRVRPWMLGMRDPQPSWGRAVLWILAVYGALLALGAIWSVVVDIPEAEIVDDLGVKANDLAAIGGAFAICVAAPIAEELLFRGLLFPSLRGHIGLVAAALVTGLAFGAVHVVGSPIEALPLLAVFGALLCALYVKTRSLLPCMVVHSINNAITYAVLLDWGWQAPLLLAGSIGLIIGGYWLVRARFGPAPLHLSPV